MSTTSRRRRQQRAQHSTSRQRGIRATGLAVLGIAVVLALGAFLFQGLWITANSLPLTTNNVKGLANTPVEIENWSDFQCGACKRFVDTIERQLGDGPIAEGLVRVVFRHKAFLGNESIQAAAASECAAEQGQFWPYHDRLYAEQNGRDAGTFSKANLKRFGAELGLDRASFDACVDGDLAVARIRAEAKAAEQRGVTKTPTLFVNGQKIEGVPTWELLRHTIDQSLVLVPNPSGPGL
jgi:protein-disulfide isomerase